MPNNTSTPKLRFPGFSGEWEVFRLGTVTRLFSNRNKNLANAEVYSVTKSNGFVLQTDHFSKVVAGEDLSSYKIVQNGDFAYNPARINVGSIARFNNRIGLISSLYVCFRPTEKLSGSFLEFFIQKNSTQFYFDVYGEGGVRVYLWYPLFSLIKISLPSLDEQRKVSDFLTLVSKKLDKESRKLILLQQYKKALMQLVFSRELGFRNENNELYSSWRRASFDSVFKSLATKRHQIQSTEYIAAGKYPVVDQGKKNIVAYSNDDSKVCTELPVIIFGDHTTTLKYIDFNFLVGADGTKMIQPKSQDSIKYLFYYLQHNMIPSEGYKRHFSILRKSIIELPSLEEQHKIANLFSTLDEKILAASSQVTLIREWHKELIESMFAWHIKLNKPSKTTS